MQYFTTQGFQMAFDTRGKGVQHNLVGAETVKKNLGNHGVEINWRDCFWNHAPNISQLTNMFGMCWNCDFLVVEPPPLWNLWHGYDCSKDLAPAAIFVKWSQNANTQVTQVRNFQHPECLGFYWVLYICMIMYVYIYYTYIYIHINTFISNFQGHLYPRICLFCSHTPYIGPLALHSIDAPECA